MPIKVSAPLAPLASLLVAFASLPATADEPRRIAITFDDAPRDAGAYTDVDTRTRLLIDALEASEVRGAMFFATTRNLDARGEEGEARLERYAAAGHVIANHSHAHGSANALSAEAFLADVSKAKRRLASFPGNTPFFRFPFLNEGDTPQKRDAIRAGLEALGLAQGYVTIDNYDWYLQALFDEAIRNGHDVDLDAWRALYVEALMGAVEHYDHLAMQALGRSPAHVLLLHENDLAALFIDDLVMALRGAGWEIIPALEAYADPIAEIAPDTMVLGQGRVAAHAAMAGTPGTALRHPWESQAELRAQVVRRGLVGLAEGAYLGQPPPGMKPERFAPGVVSRDDRYEFGITLSADGRELYFGVAIDGRGEIHTRRYRDGAWTDSEVVLSHPVYSYADPFLSADGTRLYFISNEPLGAAQPGETRDILYAQRTRSGWSEPRELPGPVNSPANEFFVSVADDGLLAFASNRHDPEGTNYDIYLAPPAGEGYEAPRVLPGRANTAAYEADPFIAPDGSYLLFSSTRRSGEGRRDLYASFPLGDGTWSRAVSLGPDINTGGIEFTPFVTRDGRFLFYSGNEDIFWVDARVISAARQRLAAPAASMP